MLGSFACKAPVEAPGCGHGASYNAQPLFCLKINKTSCMKDVAEHLSSTPGPSSKPKYLPYYIHHTEILTVVVNTLHVKCILFS